MVDPADNFGECVEVEREVPLVDGLMVRDAVADEVQSLDACFDVGSDLSWAGCWMTGKCRCERGYPERGQIVRRGEVAPETEGEFGDHLSVDLGSVSRGDAASCCRYVIQGSASLAAGEQLRLAVPRIAPPLSLTKIAESLVESVSEHDLETAKVGVERRCNIAVPVIETNCSVNVVVRCGQVRRESLRSQQAGDGFRIGH